MAKHRRIFIRKDYSPVERFNDMAAALSAGDIVGSPLGNFALHSQNRLKTCFEILLSARLAGQFDRVANPGALAAVGAVVQDKTGTQLYPAAHLAPCDIVTGLVLPSGRSQQVADVFRDRIAAGYLQRLFGTTEFVHKLVNYLDSQMERTRQGDGLSQALVDSYGLILRDRWANPREVFYDQFIPRFRELAANQQAELRDSTIIEVDDPGLCNPDGTLMNAPQGTEPWMLRNAAGDRITQAPSDQSVNSEDPRALLEVRHQLNVVLDAIITTPSPTLAFAQAAEGKFQAFTKNEEIASRSD